MLHFRCQTHFVAGSNLTDIFCCLLYVLRKEKVATGDAIRQFQI